MYYRFYTNSIECNQLWGNPSFQYFLRSFFFWDFIFFLYTQLCRDCRSWKIQTILFSRKCVDLCAGVAVGEGWGLACGGHQEVKVIPGIRHSSWVDVPLESLSSVNRISHLSLNRSNASRDPSQAIRSSHSFWLGAMQWIRVGQMQTYQRARWQR